MKTKAMILFLISTALVACNEGSSTAGAGYAALPILSPTDPNQEDQPGSETELQPEPETGDQPVTETSPEAQDPDGNPIPTFGSLFKFWGGYSVDVWFDFRSLGFDADTTIQFSKKKFVEVAHGVIGVSNKWTCQALVMIRGAADQGTIRFKNAKVIATNTVGVSVNQPCPDYETTKTVEFKVYGDDSIIAGVEYEVGE